ncbi:Ankyrin-3 [Colletotrichum viniferum]|nr:Ankyrin-3 [Colletotrichum viniferum]
MHSTVYKLLKELENTIKRSEQVVTGSRPPLEETLINDMDDSSGYSSESGSSDDGGGFSRVPVKQTELGQNTAEINHILSSLVKLSFRIRGPANRTAHLDHKALNHKELVPVDGTTMGDLLEAYSTLDRQHVEETLRQLRKNEAAVEIYDDLHVPAAVDSTAAEKSSGMLESYLVDRWSKSITSRRRVFAYWRRHAKKLAKDERPSQPRETTARPSEPPVAVPLGVVRSSEGLNTNPRPVKSHVPSSAGRTLLSGTDATKYHHDGDNIDTVSTISYVSTAFGDDGTWNSCALIAISYAPLEKEEAGVGGNIFYEIFNQEDEPTHGSNSGAAQGKRSESSLLDVSLKFSDINSKASSSPDVASLKLDNPSEENFQDKQESEENPPDPNKISNDDFAFNYYLQQRHPGTWQWFLNSTGHQTWLSQAGEKRLVLGVPGVGKSVLASVVLEDLRQRFRNDESTGVAGLFCEVYKEEGITDKLIQSFLTQLRGPEMSNSARYEENSNLPIDQISTQDLWTGSQLSRVFVVVDGLDLRARDTEFIQWLLDIAGHPKVSLLFTSRIIPTIHKALLDFPIQDLRATEADISTYAHKSLATAMTSNIYPGQLEELEERTVTFAEGVFLFAKAHIDALKDSQRMEYLSNLALLQNSRAINDFYKKIMLRVQQSKMGNTLSAWMAHSDYILEKPQAQNLMGFILNDCASDSGTFLDVNAVISSCAGLVLESSENCLTFFHHTTEEYFRQTRDTWFPDAAEEQTGICCKYLSMDAFAAGPCMSDDQWEERLLQHPFYIHAALAWGLYARKALDKHKDTTDTEAKDRVRGAILGFLRRDIKVQAAVQALKVDDTESHSSGWSQVYPKQWTNIHLAAYFGLTEILDTMLPEDGVLWDTSIDGVYSPIIVAAERGHHSTLSFMLGKLIDRSGRLLTGLYGMVGHLALAGAAQNGHEPNVRLLLTYGADPNGISGSITPLSYAVEDGHTNVVETLLEYGADPNLKTEVEGPLDLAVKNGREDIVTLLIKHGASLDKKGSAPSGSTTPQHINAEIVPFMLKDGVGVNYRNDDGFTALHISAISGHIDTVRILLNHGADATIMDNSGATPLDYAIDGGHEEVVNLILENGSEFQGLVDSIADHVS